MEIHYLSKRQIEGGSIPDWLNAPAKRDCFSFNNYSLLVPPNLFRPELENSEILRGCLLTWKNGEFSKKLEK